MTLQEMLDKHNEDGLSEDEFREMIQLALKERKAFRVIGELYKTRLEIVDL